MPSPSYDLTGLWDGTRIEIESESGHGAIQFPLRIREMDRVIECTLGTRGEATEKRQEGGDGRAC
jgi:hypothetical protein